MPTFWSVVTCSLRRNPFAPTQPLHHHYSTTTATTKMAARPVPFQELLERIARSRTENRRQGTWSSQSRYGFALAATARRVINSFHSFHLGSRIAESPWRTSRTIRPVWPTGWLTGAPLPPHLPGRGELRRLGCRALSFHGRTVALMCFELGRGKFHLFAARLSDFPEFRTVGSSGQETSDGLWRAVGWSDTGYLLVFVSHTPMD